MKFTTPFIVLLSAVTAYTYTIEKRDDNSDIIIKDKNSDISINEPNQGSTNKNDDPFNDIGDITKAGSSSITDCQDLMNKYTNCLPSINKDKSNYDESCKIYNSDECVKLLSTKVTSNDVCKDAKEFEEFVTESINSLDLACAMEDGEYCPLSKLNKEGKPITKDVVNESCKSKICREKAINGIKSYKTTFEKFNSILGNLNITTTTSTSTTQQNKQKREEFKDLNEILSFLNDSQCEAQASSAYSVKMTSSLLLTIALFFFYF